MLSAMNTRDILKLLLTDDVKPNHLTDVKWLMRYLNDECPKGDPIFLSLGETWSRTPKKLTSFLSDLPQYTHGYHLSMYGFPILRQIMRNYLIKSHSIPSDIVKGKKFEVAVTWSGTRSAMFDFGRFLLRNLYFTKPPVIIATVPGWDYSGVFEPLGFKTRNVALTPENSFQPQISNWKALIQEIETLNQEQIALLVINAQHNPTGINWDENLVRDLILLAIEKNIPVLIDDAYYGIHDANCLPTSTLKILLEELATNSQSHKSLIWLAVRSFGKQFNCNGWGIGSLVSNHQILDLLVNEYRVQHLYNYGGVFQYAFAKWLSDEESYSYLTVQNSNLEEKRRFVKRYLATELGYPADEVDFSECTFFMLIPIPLIYNTVGGTREFLKDIFFHTGVLCADAFPQPDKSFSLGYVRIFLAVDLTELKRALDRIKMAGIRFNMKTRLETTTD